MKAQPRWSASCEVKSVLKLINTATPDTTQRGLFFRICMAWRCELSRLGRQTDAFCVWSVSECVGRRSATAGRTPTQNTLVGPTSAFSVFCVGVLHTAWCDTDTTVLSSLASGVDVRCVNEVTRRRARILLGWVTVFGRVYHLDM